MPLNACIMDPATSGPVCDCQNLEACLTAVQHTSLFTHPSFTLRNFPQFSRLIDLFANVVYEPSDLETLIDEIERATVLPNLDPSLRLFFGPFHSMCVVAWTRSGQIAMFAELP